MPKSQQTNIPAHANNADQTPANMTSEDPSSAALLAIDGENPTQNDVDLSDPNAFELMIDDENAPKDEQRQEALKRMLSKEIANQKGVEISGNRIKVPGRVSLTPITFLGIFLSAIGFAAAFLHFSITSTNYLLAVFVIEAIILSQIIIYHSSYRAHRTAMRIFHIIGCLATVALIDWAFLDLIWFPKNPDDGYAILATSGIFYNCVPILMIIHLVYLGRGNREILIKTKRTKIIKKQPEKPTQIMKQPS